MVITMAEGEGDLRGHVRLYLLEHKGEARPDTLVHLYGRPGPGPPSRWQQPTDRQRRTDRPRLRPADPQGSVAVVRTAADVAVEQ